ncbi:MAG: histidine phosphatase family protein [Actinobacteria bacterium]|nr:histidine phosphatase family protein [Actinomycetota bacterium]
MLIVVRHGRTAANAAGLLQGRVDNPLDDVGRAQAAAIADVLVGCAHPLVVSSPLLRARETADAVAHRLGAPVQIDDRFLELDYGLLDGVPTKDVGADVWARWRVDPEFAPEGGESLAALQHRVEDACRDLAALAAERDVLVFSHVSPIKATVAWALGVGPATTWRMHVAQATITRVRTAPTTALTSFNEVAHLNGI